jgi:type III pantothenate kinase
MTSTGAAPLVAVDIGNSRIKLGEFQHPASAPLPLPSRSIGLSLDWTDQDLRVFLPPAPLTCRWAISSVNRPATARLLQWLADAGVQDVHLMAHGDMPLAIEVLRPELVGMDRLANAVATNRLRAPQHSAIVISMGSAIAVDLVSAAGAFSGGAILPGMAMAARALHEFTDLLPLVEVQEPPTSLGKSTEEAIRAGVYWGAVGAVRELVLRLAERHAPVEILLTGGAAPDFAAVLSKEEDPPLRFVPHLTLSGIAIAAMRAPRAGQ